MGIGNQVLEQQEAAAKAFDDSGAPIEQPGSLVYRIRELFEPCHICGIEHWKHAENEWEVKHHFEGAKAPVDV